MDKFVTLCDKQNKKQSNPQRIIMLRLLKNSKQFKRALNTSYSYQRLNRAVSHEKQHITANVPSVGDGIKSATIKQWHKKEFENALQGEPVVTLETEKVLVDVSARENCIITKVFHKENDIVQVGNPLYEYVLDTTNATRQNHRPVVEHQQSKPSVKQQTVNQKQKYILIRNLMIIVLVTFVVYILV
jgi:hypothetical protein